MSWYFVFDISRMDPNIPDGYEEIYQNNWSVIRQRVKMGRVKDTYHFPLFTISDTEIAQKLEHVLGQYNQSIKINIAFGFILKHVTTEDMKFFYPSNNTLLFEAPRLLRNNSDYRSLIDDVEYEDALSYAQSLRPSTKWYVQRIVCITIDIYKMNI